MFASRLDRTRDAMAAAGVDVVLLSVGADLPYLTGYEAMPLERLTMLVLPRDGDAVLVVPRLEAPRVVDRPGVFRLQTWEETDDPLDLVVSAMGPAATAAIGNRTWAQFLVGLWERRPGVRFTSATDIVGPIRAVKEPGEVDTLRRASAAADRVAGQLHAGDIALIGRTEAEVSADIGRRLIDEGHQRVNFAIVAAGDNAASPHHDAGDRTIRAGEIVLCDFGGTMADADGVGYCSDITRCVFTGEPPAEVSEAYDVLSTAQAAGVAAAVVGASCESVDAAGRDIIAAAGFGAHFIHRTGHGIGIDAHEDPYIVAGNRESLVVGNAFSIEPGIYLTGRWGARLEDIVVSTPAGPESLNHAVHDLVIVEG